MTGAQALSISTRVHSIEVMKPLPRIFIDEPPQSGMILYTPEYNDGFWKSNAGRVFRY
jgi:hypothetical protein